MSSKPIIYNWDDEGSPGRNLSGNNQNRLKQILKACLVDGYGDKLAAGWSMGHEDPNGFSMINGKGDFAFNIVSDLPPQNALPAIEASTIHIYCANSMTGSNGPFMEGANLCSGKYSKDHNPNTTTRHIIGFVRDILQTKISSLKWTVIADNDSFIINCANNAIYTLTLYIGKLVDVSGSGLRTFVCLGGDIQEYGTDSSLYVFCKGYSIPTSGITGLSGKGIELGAEPYWSLHSSDNKGNLVGVDNLFFRPPRVRSAEGFHGLLRGVVIDYDLYSYCGLSVLLKALGITDSGFSGCNNLIQVNEHDCVVISHRLDSASILTTNPEYWG